MATKITKWTRERGGQKDFADLTRRSHQRLKICLTSHDAAKMRELAQCATRGDTQKRQESSRKLESREDAVIRRKIERLRAQLHDVTLSEETQQQSPAKAEKDLAKRSVEELQREAQKRQRIVTRARTLVPTTPAPTTPKQRAHTIHEQVLKERARQVKEKEERVREHLEEEARWARVVVRNQQQFKEDRWKQHLHKTHKKEAFKKDLDRLCEERAASRETERAHLQRLRQELEGSEQVYLQYQHHLHTQAAQEKVRKREELLNEIEQVRARQLQEAQKEDETRESHLRYSAAKRAYARRIKQRILDKMKGKRTPVAGAPEEERRTTET
ncbi:uncharacterized protein [Procambarus clarkii]|uniref:uncharacterized protein n=1 Tax=Procambarus clarkii TaxID=6728 RepID=UPI001E6758FE|nr:caldesmon-like [Procambarus clarkii]